MSNELNMDNLADVLSNISLDQCKIIRNDRGNGCAGPMMVDASDLLDNMDNVDRVESIMDLDDDDLALVVDALCTFNHLNDLAGFTHVVFSHMASSNGSNPWQGIYLLWVPGGDILTTEQVEKLRAKWEES